MKKNSKILVVYLMVVLFASVMLLMIEDDKATNTTTVVDKSLEAGVAREEYVEAKIPQDIVLETAPALVAEPETEAAAPMPAAEPEAEAAKPEAEDTEESLLETLAKNPLGMYEITEEWVKENKGYAVEKDGKFYTVGAFVPIDNVIRYDVGYDVTGGSPYGSMFMRDLDGELEMETDEPYAALTVGDIPILKLSRQDKIRGYGYQVLNLFKTEFIGYTISVAEITGTPFPVINHNYSPDDAATARARKNEVGAFNTLTEEPVKDIRHLNYGEEYTFYWFVGTEYHEVSMLSDCKAFSAHGIDDQHDRINIQGKLNKGGYAEFDISDLEPGLYLNPIGPFVFEVTD